MIYRVAALLLVLSLFAFPAAAGGVNPGEFLVLCYHAFPEKPDPDDEYSLSRKQFAEQMEFLRTQGYQPVSFDDILMARDGKKDLPEKAVLLTFDDAYISYYEFVVPLLERLRYPSVLAVVGAFIESPPPKLPESLMTWDQIREVASRDLVQVVSHTYDLHKGIGYTLQGNVGPAAGVRTLDSGGKTYEKEEEYRLRIEADLLKQRGLFQEKLGFAPEILVWPFGAFNEISLKAARSAGYQYTFTLEDGPAQVNELQVINRYLVRNVPVQNYLHEESPIDDFIQMVKGPEKDRTLIRAVQVDLDLIYDPDSEVQTDKNLGLLIDRLVAMKVNTVFLQAFADPEGSGNIRSVYFQNRVLPVRADIFSHAVHQIKIREMSVYAWMPTLSIELPDAGRNERLKVMAVENERPVPASSWYRRLSPFSSEVRASVYMLYEDLAAHSQIQGVLFQDDAYLTDYEDFHPSALLAYKERFGVDMLSDRERQGPEREHEWARFKTETLIDFTKELMERVRKYRPGARFARNLYAILLMDPRSELWFAQNYQRFLDNYDHVVVMAYPQMDKVRKPLKWLKNMTARAREQDRGMEKTVFKLQTYDWEKERWISDELLLEEMRMILNAGGRHIAYYPDNFWEDRPHLNTIKLEMSTQDYPFLP